MGLHDGPQRAQDFIQGRRERRQGDQRGQAPGAHQQDRLGPPPLQHVAGGRQDRAGAGVIGGE